MPQGKDLMKIFFYMGRNDQNVSRVSWKVWKIERKGRRVFTQWGPAILRDRKPVLEYIQWSKETRFGTEAGAKEYEQKKIESKLAKGYQRSPRMHS
jgi:predicted DNA-binding WGR domain protein